MFVYFMKPIGRDGPIKIGYTRRPLERLHSINLWCPFPLEVVASVPGTRKLERVLHQCFAEYYSHAEWFHPGPLLVRAIEALKAGASIEDAVDLTKTLPHVLPKYGYEWTPERRAYQSLLGRIRWASRRSNTRVPAEFLAGSWRDSPLLSDPIMSAAERYIRDPRAYLETTPP